MGLKTEHYTGSDCTLSSGDANRVLTISNTGTTTGNGFSVYASGLALALTTEYTVSHKSASTEITFINSLWDDTTIQVNYYQSTAPTVILSDVATLIDGQIEVYGELVTLTRKAGKTYSDWGDESNTESTIEDVKTVFNVYGTDAPFTSEGRFNNGDITFFFKSDQDYIEIGTKIERSNENTYEIKDVRAHGIQGSVHVREALVEKV